MLFVCIIVWKYQALKPSALLFLCDLNISINAHWVIFISCMNSRPQILSFDSFVDVYLACLLLSKLSSLFAMFISLQWDGMALCLTFFLTERFIRKHQNRDFLPTRSHFSRNLIVFQDFIQLFFADYLSHGSVLYDLSIGFVSSFC